MTRAEWERGVRYIDGKRVDMNELTEEQQLLVAIDDVRIQLSGMLKRLERLITVVEAMRQGATHPRTTRKRAKTGTN